MDGWNVLFVGQKTEEWSDYEEGTESRGRLTENRFCIGVVYTIRLEVGVGGETNPAHQPSSW